MYFLGPVLLCETPTKYKHHMGIPPAEESHEKHNPNTCSQENAMCVGSSLEHNKESSIHLLPSVSESLNIMNQTLSSMERSMKKMSELTMTKPMDHYNRIKLEWTFISSVLDRLFIFLYLIAIAVSLGLFLPRP